MTDDEILSALDRIEYLYHLGMKADVYISPAGDECVGVQVQDQDTVPLVPELKNIALAVARSLHGGHITPNEGGTGTGTR